MYKILVINEEYKHIPQSVLKTIALSQVADFKTVDFAMMCTIKNIKPKPGVQRWQYRKLQADRMCAIYPSEYTTAKMLGLTGLPDIEADNQPSSWNATKAYIKHMYGETYAKGFERADYPKLRKAA